MWTRLCPTCKHDHDLNCLDCKNERRIPIWRLRRYVRGRDHFFPNRFYGIAWVVMHQDAYVCYPVPLNIILGQIRRGCLWLRFPWANSKGDLMERIWNAAYKRGSRSGRKITAQVRRAKAVILGRNAGEACQHWLGAWRAKYGQPEGTPLDLAFRAGWSAGMLEIRTGHIEPPPDGWDNPEWIVPAGTELPPEWEGGSIGVLGRSQEIIGCCRCGLDANRPKGTIYLRCLDREVPHCPSHPEEKNHALCPHCYSVLSAIGKPLKDDTDPTISSPEKDE